MTKMHLMWFCAFSPHAGFGLDGWAGPRTTGYEWTRPELWQDMAAATRRIGLAATLSTTFYPPFLLARLMTTLDHLSRGRIAWNVVTSYKREEALNFGYQELLDHDQHYDRADE